MARTRHGLLGPIQPLTLAGPSHRMLPGLPFPPLSQSIRGSWDHALLSSHGHHTVHAASLPTQTPVLASAGALSTPEPCACWDGVGATADAPLNQWEPSSLSQERSPSAASCGFPASALPPCDPLSHTLRIIVLTQNLHHVTPHLQLMASCCK